MFKNNNLRKAKKEKNDEFYTLLSDIEKEVSLYKHHFKNKVVYCNCDDPYASNFFKYFVLNFNDFEIRKLIATNYSGLLRERTPYKAVITKCSICVFQDRLDFDQLFSEDGNSLEVLHGDGDFRSEECVKLLDEADIIVTNPPFSIASEFYVPLLIEHQKKFIIVGDLNWVTYKTIFPLIKENKMWLGNTSIKNFLQPNGTVVKFGNKLWYTNFDIVKIHKPIDLVEKYSPEKFPKYDNYDAIEVSKTSEIPCDYDGAMGVPISFLNIYNPDQFEILGITDRQNTSGLRYKKYTEKDDPKFNDLNARSVLKTGGVYNTMYVRILIRNKNPETPDNT